MDHETDHETFDGRRRRHLRSVDPDRLRVTPSSAGDVSVYYQSGAVVVLLSGRIDISQAQDLEEAGSYAIQQNSPITVDVRHVDLIDSVGVSFLVRVAASIRSEGGSIFLCGPAPYVQELLEVAGADSLFTWVEGRVGPGGLPTP